MGYPHEVYGEDIYAFVILKDGANDLEESVIGDLQQLVRKHIGAFAVPQSILVGKELTSKKRPFVIKFCIN